MRFLDELNRNPDLYSKLVEGEQALRDIHTGIKTVEEVEADKQLADNAKYLIYYLLRYEVITNDSPVEDQLANLLGPRKLTPTQAILNQLSRNKTEQYKKSYSNKEKLNDGFNNIRKWKESR